ncbi:MAG: pyridoxal 5'-phosphate synthase glutaminase subunit PdxT [Acidimicrobiia bacterium]
MVAIPVVGVLALQGAYARHARALEACGATTVEVRRPQHLEGIDALVVPGGESSTISMLLERGDLFDPIAGRLRDGMAAFGTCAGMILLGSEIVGGRPDQRCFGAIDLSVRRNAYGRQVDSFDIPLDLSSAGVQDPTVPFDASFIRAPVVERVGEGVQVLAEVDGRPVLCASGPVLVAAFHPELSDDLRIHRRFLEEI